MNVTGNYPRLLAEVWTFTPNFTLSEESGVGEEFTYKQSGLFATKGSRFPCKRDVVISGYPNRTAKIYAAYNTPVFP